MLCRLRWALIFVATDMVGWACENDFRVGIAQSRCGAGVGTLGGKIVNWWVWGEASSRSRYLMAGSKPRSSGPSGPDRVGFGWMCLA